MVRKLPSYSRPPRSVWIVALKPAQCDSFLLIGICVSGYSVFIFEPLGASAVRHVYMFAPSVTAISAFTYLMESCLVDDIAGW